MRARGFRIAIGVYLAAVVFAIVGRLIGIEALPAELREFARHADKNTWLVGWGGVVYLTAASAACIGMLLMRNWARHLFVAVTAVGAMPWDGPVVYTSLENLFLNLEFVLAGVIICAAYFSPVGPQFDRTKSTDV